MKKLNFVLIIFLILSISVYSQSRVDVIKLKNGDIYQGHIIKDVPGDYIQIEMKSGLIKMIKYPDIESREVENFNKKEENDRGLKEENSDSFFPVVLNLGIGLLNLNFSKELENPMSLEEKGWMPGIVASVNTNKNQNFYGSMELAYYIGKTTRDYTNNLGNKSSTDLKNDYFKFNLKSHYQFKISEQVFISPFVGYSYTSYYRETIPANDSLISFKYTFSFNQIPLGLDLDFIVNKELRFVISTQANISLSSNEKYWQMYQTQKYNRIYPDRPEINLELGNEVGFNISGGFEYLINSNLSLNFHSYLENISYSKSNVVTYTEKVNNNSYTYNMSDAPGKLSNLGFIFGLSYNFN